MSDNWYYGINGQQQGPVTKAVLGQMFARGEINRQYIVWNEQLPNWLPIGDVPELRDICGGGASPSLGSGSSASMEARYQEAKAFYDSDNYEVREKAWPLFEALAHEGHREAQFCHGYHLYSGGAKDEGMKWIEKAGDGGNVQAQEFIANRYLDGDEVEQDYAKAIEWFRKAERQGSVPARDALQMLKEMGYI